jgi:hypothetical protein
MAVGSTRGVVDRLRDVEAAVRAAVEARRAVDPVPDDPFRGLYIGDDEIDRLLAAPAAGIGALGAWSDVGETDRLRATAQRFGLDLVDVDLLLVAVAPDVDCRFERFYGYLHDDVSRRRASIGLALELCGLPPASVAARRRLGAAGALVAGGLVTIEDADRPFLTRALRVPDRVATHLLGGDLPDPPIAALLVDPAPVDIPADDPLVRVLAEARRHGSGGLGGAGEGVLYVTELPGASGRSYAAAAAGRAGHDVLVADLGRVTQDDPVGVLSALAREARLRQAVLVAGPVEAIIERVPTGVELLAERAGLSVLTGRVSWEPAWSPRVPLIVTAAAPSAAARGRAWAVHLDGHLAHGVDAVAATTQFRLTPEQVAEAATAARHQATVAGTAVGEQAIRAGARSRNGAGLERRSRRIEPAVGWDDLVLPGACRDGLDELVARMRHREQVLREWAMRPGGGRGRGVTALFAGDSGTGKTMSAEVVAGALGLDLYVVDLATVVDKYVGETEKNLERIFGEADGVNGVLLFDEADALFGKRSEVRDAHDRYANIEVAYLLQRMETFDGLAILTTNLRANLDDAFTRRLDVIVDFPLPDAVQRRQLWQRCLGDGLPRAADVDLDFCAEQFELTGGNIRSIALTAAYLVAEWGGPLSMADLMRATLREYRKLGRLLVGSEFGPWLDIDSQEDDRHA